MADAKTKVEPVNGGTQMVMVPSAVIAKIKELGESVRLVLINELSEPSRSAFWAGVEIRNLATIAEDGDKANAAPQPAASDVPHDAVRALDEAPARTVIEGGCGYPCGYDCNGACFPALATPAPSTSTEEARQWPAFVYDSESGTSTERCEDCGGTGLVLNSIGEPDDCRECDGGFRAPTSTEEALRAESAQSPLTWSEVDQLHSRISELEAENARLREELACTLDELIDHNGDDMIDSRQKRADELRAPATPALSR